MKPARLKSLELQGYKTFASRTLFEFSDLITCIVGPNGSGKSNIADSMRWVLGEQSYSLLRGKKTEDMIFSGSEQRPRAGMASATITFDNTHNWLPIDFSEVAITRRAYRDGTNEYLINGQRVRLKDVSELLAQSGLAERTYTIIGQGLVDAALALKAEERRRLFEEAAGIGLYRTRREEALRRLEITRRNLERVQDILAELQPRLRSLERQARRAQEYEQVRSDLKVLLREWYGFHWNKAQTDLAEAIEIAHQREQSLEEVRRQQAGLDEQVGELHEKIQGARAQLNSWHRQLAELHSQREALIRSLAVADERQRSYNEQSHGLAMEATRLLEEQSVFENRLGMLQQDISAREEDLKLASSQLEQARRALSDRQQERQAIDEQLRLARQESGSLYQRQNILQARQVEMQTQRSRNLAILEQTQKASLSAENELSQVIASLQSALHARDKAVEQRKEAEIKLQNQQ
jgi:chromosome segregation protein